MRDVRFKTIRRGGLLDSERHRRLALWAAECAEHVLYLFNTRCPGDERPQRAIETARAWSRGQASVGDARRASVEAHAAARAAGDEAARAVARAAGHAAATAHMADHSRGAALYAAKAVQAAHPDENRFADRERAWQRKRLPEEVRSLILSDE